VREAPHDATTWARRPPLTSSPATTGLCESEANRSMAILQLTNAAGITEDVALDQDRMVMGRHPDCEIVLDAASVSRQHAQILR